MKIFLILIAIFYITSSNQAQIGDIDCGTSYNEETKDFSQRGGKYLTSSGELKVLVVFAKFKDDNSAHQFWQTDSYPAEMSGFIDQTIENGSTHYLNLTNYFNQMSFGNFKVIGKAIGIQTPHPVSHYIPDNEIYPDRSRANKDILQSVDDSIDFRNFDNWTYISNYYHSNEPDGIVDMVVIIWRGLVFTDNWSGEASLGGGSEFWVENNQIKIRMGFGGSMGFGTNGSGVTIQYWSDRSSERNLKVVIHEIAHWLVHGEHPYNSFNHTFWGMLTLGSEGICANAFERERVAWINPILINSTILSAPMGDYITTPSAYKFHPANGNQNEMYYFENHQQVSIYDNGTSNGNDKGIFILHFEHNYYVGDCVRILTADGFWNWNSPFYENCWGKNTAAFQKAAVNRHGFGNRDRITFNNSISEFLYSFVNDDNQTECNDWLHGYGFSNAFNSTFNDVFSSWSNPPAKTWSGQSTDFIMEIINQCGTIVTARFAVQNSLAGKPSKPYLGWDPRKFEYQYGWIYLVWGADYWDGIPIESDVCWSELQRKIGGGEWNTVYIGANRFWSDGSINYNPGMDEPISFRVKVRDNQNKWSIWSNVFENKLVRTNLTSLDTLLNQPLNVNSNGYILHQNYPNPFNPSTIISWQSSVGSRQSLRVFDILGNEVATLLDEWKEAGSHSVSFDASALPSGVYLYKIQAGSFVDTKKMLLLR